MGTRNNPGKFDCFSNAEPDEPMFVLLGRDPCAPILIGIWAELRKRMGENQEKVDEAEACEVACERWLSKLGKDDDYTRVLKLFEDYALQVTECCFDISVIRDRRLEFAEFLQEDES